MSIILYDIPSSLTHKAWSPNTWKTRFCLNYKGIPYKTEWVEYPDIAPLSKKLGLKPTGKNSWDDSDYYSLPAIHDPSTNVYIADSLLIAEYLDAQYPDTPAIFPNRTLGLQIAFNSGFSNAISASWDFILPATASKLNPRSEEYFSRTKAIPYKRALDDVLPKGEHAIAEWAKFKAGLEKVNRWFEKTDTEGSFILGATVSWADIQVASYMMWFKVIWGENSREWSNIRSWDGGRWNNLLIALDRYAVID